MDKVNTFLISIRVTYDNSQEVPSSEDLQHQIFNAIGDGLLVPRFSECIVDDYNINVAEL